jgi:2-dehydro-3-deoxyphosphooctonate aldolase (KDO 8-P synthase)
LAHGNKQQAFFIMHSTLQEIKENRGRSLFLMAGPCVIEDETMGFVIAEKIAEITRRLEIPYIFKASYMKANRSSMKSFTGIGNEIALNVLEQIGKQFDIPVMTDIHTNEEAFLAARQVDVLQIPAFLCRQTELLVAAGQTGRMINIKKGQFLNPQSISFAIEKVKYTNNQNVMVTERGTTFGYGDLVVDFRGIPQMQEFGVPVIMDVTHSLQLPNQPQGVSGGQPQFIDTIACAAVAAGVDGIFIETHPQPQKAKSDGSNMLPLDLLEELLEKLIRIRKAIKPG